MVSVSMPASARPTRLTAQAAGRPHGGIAHAGLGPSGGWRPVGRLTKEWREGQAPRGPNSGTAPGRSPSRGERQRASKGEGVHGSGIRVTAIGRGSAGCHRCPQNRCNPQNLPPLVYRRVSRGNFGGFFGAAGGRPGPKPLLPRSRSRPRNPHIGLLNCGGRERLARGMPAGWSAPRSCPRRPENPP